jgi:hypothetical protein
MTTPTVPMLLKILLTAVAPHANWASDGSPFAIYPYQWTVTFTVYPQSISIAADSYAYTGTNIIVGDWISNAIGGMAWIIRSISAQTTSTVTCVVEDVNQYNTYADPSTNGDGSPPNHIQGFVFATDQTGQPILSPVPINVLTSEWQTDLMSRFAVTSPPVTTALTGYTTGSSVTTSNLVLTLQSGVPTWVSLSTLLAQANAILLES